MEATLTTRGQYAHMTNTVKGEGCNSLITCTCGWSVRQASAKDESAVRSAYRHVTSPEIIDDDDCDCWDDPRRAAIGEYCPKCTAAAQS